MKQLQGLLPIAGLFVQSVLRSGTAEIAVSARRFSRAAILAIVAATMATAAFGCAVAALWIYAAQHLGPVGGALCAAGAFLVLAGITAGIARMGSREEAAPPPPPAPPPIPDMHDLFKDHPASALLAALVAGLLTGNSGRKS